MQQRKKPIKASETDLKEKVVAINRVAKVVKGGRRFSFSAIVVVGRVTYEKVRTFLDALRPNTCSIVLGLLMPCPFMTLFKFGFNTFLS